MGLPAMSLAHRLPAEAAVFLKELFARLESTGLDLRFWSIDHLCYRTASLERYEVLKRELLPVAEQLAEAEVNGRPIAVFKLKTPLRWERFLIDLIELPAPKPGKPKAEGFEHAEVVC